MKKNRFYYSFDQECIALKFGDWDETMSRIEAVRENYVLTLNGYRKYTQWCSTPGSKCNWDDAKLVFETDDDPKIKITYRKTSQLQALEDENAKLRKLLADSENKCYTLESYTNFITNQCNKLIKENKQLEQQLKNAIVLEPDHYVIITNGWKNKKYGVALSQQRVQNNYIKETDGRMGCYVPCIEFGKFESKADALAKLEELKGEQ